MNQLVVAYKLRNWYHDIGGLVTDHGRVTWTVFAIIAVFMSCNNRPAPQVCRYRSQAKNTHFFFLLNWWLYKAYNRCCYSDYSMPFGLYVILSVQRGRKGVDKAPRLSIRRVIWILASVFVKLNKCSHILRRQCCLSMCSVIFWQCLKLYWFEQYGYTS